MPIGAPSGFQLNANLAAVMLEWGRQVALIANQESANGRDHVPHGFTLTALGRRQTKACNDAGSTDEQMPMKAIVGLLFSGTVALSGNAFETAAAGSMSKAT